MRDFSLKAYLNLVDAIRAKELAVFGVLDWLQKAPKRGVVIRHDVDRRPHNALEMAKAEHAIGLRTTYYFRVVGSANNPEIIRSVAELGHEVGYHYEDLALVKGDVGLVEKSFKSNLAYLRSIVPINTVAMHGSPMSRHNNLDIWKTICLKDHGLLGEAFLTIDYSGIFYFTDTGRSWDSAATNFRDRPPGATCTKLKTSGTDGLINFVTTNRIEKMALSVHPERWDESVAFWSLQFGKDVLVNTAKRVISLGRK